MNDSVAEPAQETHPTLADGFLPSRYKRILTMLTTIVGRAVMIFTERDTEEIHSLSRLFFEAGLWSRLESSEQTTLIRKTNGTYLVSIVASAGEEED